MGELLGSDRRPDERLVGDAFRLSTWIPKLGPPTEKFAIRHVQAPYERGRTTHMRQIRQNQLFVPVILLAGTQVDRPRVAQFSVAIVPVV